MTRFLRRCNHIMLFTIAIVLIVVAIFSATLRLHTWHFTGDSSVVKWLPLPADVSLKADDISIGLSGRDLAIQVRNVHATATPVHDVKLPVFTLKSGNVRLNLFRSLRLRQPSFDQLDLDQPTIRLFQHPDGRWWSASKESTHSSGFDKHALQRWLQNVAGSRARISHGVFELHGLHETQRVMLSTARLVADELGNTSFRLQAHLDGQKNDGLSFNASLAPDNNTSGRAELFGDARQISTIASMLTSSAHYAFRSSGNLHAQINWWGTARANLRTSFDLNDLWLARTDDPQRRLALKSMAASLAADYKRGHWKGRFANVGAYDSQGHSLDLPGNGQLIGSADELSVRLPRFRVDAANLVWPLLPSSQELRQTFIDLHPCGEVSAARLDLNLRDGINWRDRLHIRADARGATIAAHDQIPALGPVSGTVDMTLRHGTALLTGDKGVGMDLPEVFATRWPLRSLSGRLDWTLDDRFANLRGSDIKMERDGAQLSGKLLFDSPDDDYKRFNLSVKLENGVLNQASDWVPLRTLSPELGAWLNANVRHARAPTGSLEMKMLFGNPDGHPELEKHVDFTDRHGPNQLHLALQIRDGTLGYLEGWPAATDLKGEFTLDGVDMHGNVSHARMHGLNAHDGSFALEDNVLRLGFPASGDVGQVLDLLKQVPFENRALNEQFKRWDGQGPMIAQVHLTLPFSDEHDSRVDFLVDAHVHDAKASMVANQLDFTHVNSSGSLHMLGDRLAIKGNADGQLLGGKVAGRYQLVNGAGGVDFDGHIDVLKAMQWLKIAGIAPDTSGSTDYSGRLSVPADDPVTLDLKADSRGVRVPLPAPLGKPADDPRPMVLHMDLTNGIGEVEIQHLVKARWRNQLENGQVWVANWPTQPQWQSQNGWSIEANIPRFDPQQWVAPLQRLDYNRIGSQSGASGAQAGSDNTLVINRLAFDTDCLVLNDRCLGPLKLRAQMADNKAWSGSVSSHYLQGNAHYDPAGQTPVNIDIKELVLDPLLDMLKPNAVASKPQSSARNPVPAAPELYRDTLALPPLDTSSQPFPDGMASIPSGVLNIAHIKARKHNGHAHLRWTSNADALRIPDFELALAGTRVGGQAGWFKAGQSSLTSGHAVVHLGDVARLLDIIGQQKLMTTDKGSVIKLGYAWPGVPWQPQLKTVTASADLRMGAGNLVAMNMIAARVMSLFNIDNLWRRLHLDFSDVTHKGTAFNSVDGQLVLADGILSNVKPVVIKAPSTNFSVDGHVDLINQRLENQLVIQLPVSQTLPLAAVAVGAPEIGGALLLLHWAIGGWMNQATELHYLVHGPWSNPSFDLEHGTP